jgi:hypothetical protein
MSVGVEVAQGTVEGVAVFVQRLRVGDGGVGERAGRERVGGAEGIHRAAGEFIGREEAAVAGRVVAGDEKVEVRFRVAFFAGLP